MALPSGQYGHSQSPSCQALQAISHHSLPSTHHDCTQGDDNTAEDDEGSLGKHTYVRMIYIVRYSMRDVMS